METHPVHLTGLSKAQMSRLRNGHACRCGLGSKGEGVSAHLGTENIKKLMKAAKKGAKSTLRLGKEEIDANQMHGTGLVAGGKLKMPKKVKTILHSKPVQDLKKKIIEKGGDYVSDQIEDQLEKRGVPSSIAKPIARAGTKAGAKKLDKATGGKLKVGKTLKKVAHSKPVQSLKKKVIEKGREYVADKAEEELEKRGVPPGLARAAAKKGSKLGAKQLDKATGGGLYAARGGAIGMARRVESVGAGGNLLHRHPSQMSQAHSANFHFSTQFPPGLAEVRGSGLYV